MKKLAILLVVIGGLSSGCIPIVEGPSRGGGGGGVHRSDRDRDGVPDRMDRDRDGDGVSNRNDRRPNDPHRY
jgi:hypothetical protein